MLWGTNRNAKEHPSAPTFPADEYLSGHPLVVSPVRNGRTLILIGSCFVTGRSNKFSLHVDGQPPIFVWLNSEFNYFPPGLSLAFMSSQTGFFQSFPPTLHHLDWFNQVDCSTPTNRHVTVGFSATSRTLRRQPRPSAAPCRAALAPMTSGCRVAETCRDGQIFGGHGWPQI